MPQARHPADVPEGDGLGSLSGLDAWRRTFVRYVELRLVVLIEFFQRDRLFIAGLRRDTFHLLWFCTPVMPRLIRQPFPSSVVSGRHRSGLGNTHTF